jgi:hypothetical protein
VDGVTTEGVLDVAGGPSASLGTGLPEVIGATTAGSSIYCVQIQGQILARYDTGAWGYVLPDAFGSVRQLVDAAGQVTLAQSYNPFGVLISQSPNLPVSQSSNLPVSQSPNLPIYQFPTLPTFDATFALLRRIVL